MYLIVLILFLIPLVFSFSYGTIFDWPKGRDETLYYNVGKSYLQGVLRLDFSVFNLNPEHPPLAKLVIGVLDSMLSYWNLDYFPVAVRLHASLFLSLTCLVIFFLGKKIGGFKVGILSWILLIPQFFLAPYGLWLGKELNNVELGGITPIFLSAPLDIPCLFFITSSIYFLIDLRENHSIYKAGLCFGLASLTKLIAIPTVPMIILIWLFFQRKKTSEIVQVLIRFVATGLIVFYIGNPAVWNPQYFFSPFAAMAGVENTSTWYEFFILNMRGEDGLFFLARFLMTVLMYPIGLFVELYLVMLFIVLLLYLSSRKIQLSDSQTLLLIWFGVMYLFFSLIARTVMIGSYLVNYYAIQYFVPLALFSASIIPFLHQDLLHRLRPSTDSE